METNAKVDKIDSSKDILNISTPIIIKNPDHVVNTEEEKNIFEYLC